MNKKSSYCSPSSELFFWELPSDICVVSYGDPEEPGSGGVTDTDLDDLF